MPVGTDSSRPRGNQLPTRTRSIGPYTSPNLVMNVVGTTLMASGAQFIARVTSALFLV